MKERGRRSTSRDALFGGLRGSKDYNGLSVLVGDQGAVAHKLVDLREIRLLGRIAGLEGLHHSPGPFGAIPQQLRDHQDLQLGRTDTGGFRIGDPVIVSMAAAGGAGNVGVQGGEQAAKVAHIGGAGGPVVAEPDLVCSEERCRAVLCDVHEGGSIDEGRIAGPVRDGDGGAQARAPAARARSTFWLLARIASMVAPRTKVLRWASAGIILTEVPPAVRMG